MHKMRTRLGKRLGVSAGRWAATIALLVPVTSCRHGSQNAPEGYAQAPDFPDRALCSLGCAVGWTTYVTKGVAYSKDGWTPKVGDRIRWAFSEENFITRDGPDPGVIPGKSVRVFGVQGTLRDRSGGTLYFQLLKNGKVIGDYKMPRSTGDYDEIDPPNTVEPDSWYEIVVTSVEGKPVVHDIELSGGRH